MRFTPSEWDAVVRLPNSVRAGTTLGLEPVRPTARSWSRLSALLRLIGVAGVGDAGRVESAARRSGSLLLGALLWEAYGDGGARVLTAPQRDADPHHALVRRFRLAVRAEPNATHGVAWHARALGVSPRTLTELVRDASDAIPGTLVRAGIAAEAARLLRASDDPIHRVATRLGCSDAAYFSRCVRRELGVAPGQLRAAR
ncbi:helix-turn-helix domain-containing protein [Leucobacter chromiireducens]|uniref:Helix-turn-helix domain-containing protein n=1 Tax=Leucobacter chromiireducens subsp. solipictus TaxID=398235 RepID=A0ABS1SHJ1_9MICO|nr:helix-turn-helix domain-containing protein [Leucobacter chromiireducens subsp. solipictus]